MAARRPRSRTGLRLRIAAVAAVAVGVVLTIGAILLVGLLRSRLHNAAETSANLRAQDVAALATASSLPRQLAFPGEESGFVQVVDTRGTVLASTGNLQGEPPVAATRPLGDEPVRFTLDVAALGDAKPMRVVAVNADTPAGRVTVYAGESLQGANDTIQEVETLLALSLPVLVGLVGGVTWWAVGRTLRPVRAITGTLAEITASDLHRRVPSSTSRDEIGQLATTVNETLTRLDTAVTQQRRFVADASHELRGPLAALRADLEISVAHPAQTEWATVAADTLGDVERLQHLTDDLLLLARLDAHAAPRVEAVDLRELARDALAAVRRSDVIVPAVDGAAEVVVCGDRRQLTRMIRNLVHNAEQHCTGNLRVSVGHRGAHATLTVADDGPGIPIEERERVFERFTRLDSARTAGDGGSGLGLSIVHDVVTAHHGSVTIEAAIPHGTIVHVELPTGEAAADREPGRT